MTAAESSIHDRVLVFLPSGRDARTMCDSLRRAGHLGHACADLDGLCRELRVGAALAVMTEDTIVADKVGCLKSLLDSQPSWSDLPLVVLTRGTGDSAKARLVRDAARNAVLLERPIRIHTFLSVVGSLVNARRRQYQIRDFMEERRVAEEKLWQSEAALRRTDRAKDEFLAMVAHELRNPLAAVNNAVAVLKKTSDEDDQRWATGVIERQSKQLRALIDDLLDVSRVTSGKVQLRAEVVDVAAVLDRAVEAASPLFAEKSHELSVSCKRDALFVLADPVRLEQVVVNLLTNAAKYTEPRGRIELSARGDDWSVTISVKDTGIGIAAEALPNMFELFSQVDSALPHSRGGLGIGLNIVRSLVEMQGGKVQALSEGVGRGSEFVLTLPPASRPVSREAPAESPSKVSLTRSRTLVVDDSVDTAKGLARLLTLLGNEVRIAFDGPTAIEVASDFEPEHILLDLSLPGMDGFEVATRLRAHECCKDAQLIAISGYGSDDDQRRALAAGFDRHLVKPVDYEALVALLAQPA